MMTPTPMSTSESAPIEAQDDIDAERFKQMVKKPDAQPEEDIDAERFNRLINEGTGGSNP